MESLISHFIPRDISAIVPLLLVVVFISLQGIFKRIRSLESRIAYLEGQLNIVIEEETCP